MAKRTTIDATPYMEEMRKKGYLISERTLPDGTGTGRYDISTPNRRAGDAQEGGKSGSNMNIHDLKKAGSWPMTESMKANRGFEPAIQEMVEAGLTYSKQPTKDGSISHTLEGLPGEALTDRRKSNFVAVANFMKNGSVTKDTANNELGETRRSRNTETLESWGLVRDNQEPEATLS